MNLPSLALRFLFPALMAVVLPERVRAQEGDVKPEVVEKPPVEQVLGTWLNTKFFAIPLLFFLLLNRSVYLHDSPFLSTKSMN